MSRRLLFLLVFIFSVLFAQSQMEYLFVKKGYKKKKTYTEGDRISLQLKNDSIYNGLITQLRDDVIYVNGLPVLSSNVKSVILRQKSKETFHIDGKKFLLITGGVALVTAGLTLSKQADFQEALTAGLVIGYGPLLVQYIGSKISLHRKRYRIGKKFRLQVFDLN